MSVIDASIVVRLLLARQGDDALRKRFADFDERLHAPSHLDAEVLSAIIGMLNGAKIEADRARRMIGQFQDLRIARHPVGTLGGRVLTLRHNFTVYDAAYVALAEELQQPLLTTDAKFTRAPQTVTQWKSIPSRRDRPDRRLERRTNPGLQRSTWSCQVVRWCRTGRRLRPR